MILCPNCKLRKEAIEQFIAELEKEYIKILNKQRSTKT